MSGCCKIPEPNKSGSNCHNISKPPHTQAHITSLRQPPIARSYITQARANANTPAPTGLGVLSSVSLPQQQTTGSNVTCYALRGPAQVLKHNNQTASHYRSQSELTLSCVDKHRFLSDAGRPHFCPERHTRIPFLVALSVSFTLEASFTHAPQPMAKHFKAFLLLLLLSALLSQVRAVLLIPLLRKHNQLSVIASTQLVPAYANKPLQQQAWPSLRTVFFLRCQGLLLFRDNAAAPAATTPEHSSLLGVADPTTDGVIKWVRQHGGEVGAVCFEPHCQAVTGQPAKPHETRHTLWHSCCCAPSSCLVPLPYTAIRSMLLSEKHLTRAGPHSRCATCSQVG